MSRIYRLMTVFSCLLLLALFTPLSMTYAQTCTDVDGDGYGLNGDASCPAPGVDCDDDDPNVYPDAPRICDAKDSDCDGFEDFFTDKDQDGDGSTLCTHWLTGLKDCDDSNPVMYPGNVEGPFGDPTCSDGFDNDCDFRKDGSDNGCSVNCVDSDGDGYGNPGNVTCPNGNALDCNDSNDLINPGVTDTNCNGVDDNCSGTADDGYVVTGTNCGTGECASTGTLSCSGGVETDSCVAGLPVKEGALGHPTCSDTLDNDCDGATDGTDAGCQGTCLDDDGDGYGFYGDPSCPNGAVVDCNDDDAAINPGATDDVCDGVDANCSGTPDDEYTPTVTNCGIGECATTGLLECIAGATVDNCSPLAPGTEGPFGDPTCSDTLDNDCDGVVDAPDNDCNPLDQDNDGDGFCEIGPCQNPANLGGDCDDTDSVTFPGATRICDARDNDCDGFQDFFTDVDGDGDGVPMCGGDCDDNNPLRSPLLIEGPWGDATCSDFIDNDCDYKQDQADAGCGINCLDTDGDGYGNPGNPSCTNGGALDCDNFNALINPGATDTNCNGVDDNCSGIADDGYVVTPTNCGVGECASTGNLTCSNGVENNSCTAGAPVVEGPLGDATCGDTLDNDCDGLTDGTDPGCGSPCLDDDGDGYGLFGDASCPNAGVDCDDNNSAINLGATDDVCDGVDANCSGIADDQYVPPVTNCGIGECATTGLLVCNAGVPEDNCSPLAPGVEGPFGDPTCGDTLDNDCDGDIDAVDNSCNPLDIDNDLDGYCEGPTCSDGSTPGDCDDTDLNVYPGAARVCDGKDNDCDGFQDFFTDKDADGDGTTLCVHYQTGLQDCNDNDPNRFPGNIEAFGDPSCDDGIDNDCNYKIDGKDIKCLDQCNDGDGDGYGNPAHPSCANPELDCDNTNNLVNPGATDDTCDGVDNNCSGTPDDEYVPSGTNCGVGECATTGTLTCSGGVETDSCTPLAPAKEGALGNPTCSDTFDNDCDGTTDASDIGCQSPCLDDDGDGYGYFGDPSCTNPGVDCDDDNAAINPGATDDVCDGVDANCSGTADDGYLPTPTNCGIGECVTTGQLVCVAGAPEDNCTPLPAGIEDYLTAGVCTDTLDNDCDGDIDLGDIGCNPPDIDNDGDGFCEGPTCSDATTPGDCNDTDDTVRPGGDTTLCDGKDTNCDGFQDFFSDVDNDGDGVPLCAGDCNDNDPDRYPGNQEGPWVDATCLDAIDNDCDTKIDNADADCAQPTCTTRTNPTDGPHMFDLLDGGNNVLKTPCQWCHFTDYQGMMLDERVECQRCHAPASDTSDPLNGILKEQVPGPVNGNQAPTAYPAAPPYGFGTAQDVKLHSSTVVGTTHGAWDMDCITCHNPHLQEQDARYGTGYGKLIKEKICFNNAVTAVYTEEFVEFTAPSGTGSFADGPPHTENICEICHTQTSYHLNDGSTVVHNDGDNCTTCHPHGDGFAPTGGVADAPHNNTANPGVFPNCAVCHVTETDFTTPVPSANCLNCHDEAAPLKAGGGSDIKVRSHFIGTMECIECHNPMFAQINFRGNPNLSHVRTTVNGNEIAFEAKTGPFSFADDTNAAANGMLPENYICNTCHIDQTTNHHQADGTAPGGQSHNDGIDCTGCHTHQGGSVVPDAFRDHIENSQADTPHNNTDSPGLFDLCSVCHVAEDDFVTPIPNTKCLNCHDGTPATMVETHHTPGDLECVECHNPMRAQANWRHIRSTLRTKTVVFGTPTVAPAAAEYATGTGTGLCEVCHVSNDYYRNEDNQPAPFPGHNAGAICTSCHTHITGMAPPVDPADTPHEGITDCTLCHDPGTYVIGGAIPNSKCLGCHDIGAPGTGSGGSDTKVETHHTPGDLECVECHNPMRAQANWRHIRSTLRTKTVVFGTPTVAPAAAEYATGTGTGLCEVCHVSNDYYRNEDNQPAPFPGHNAGAICTSCHTHITGMAPPVDPADTPHEGITDCTLCHDPGTYVIGGAIPNSKCLGCHDIGAPGTGSGGSDTKVETHHTPGDLECVECHNPMRAQANWRHIRSTLRTKTVVFGTPTVAPAAAEYATGTGTGLCEVCHVSNDYYRNEDNQPAPFPDHNAGAICTSCHTHEAGFQPVGGIPPFPHDTQDCTTCHTGASFSDPITDAACLSCHDEAAPGSGSFNQVDDFTGLTTGDAGRPTFGNWTGVPGDDTTNGWMVWNGATNTSGTGPSDGNPSEYVVLESSASSGGLTVDTMGFGTAGNAASNSATSNRYVDRTNPATADATITSISANMNSTGNITFYTISSISPSCTTSCSGTVTDIVTVNASSTGVNTWNGLSLAVNNGDHLGFVSTSATVRRSSSGIFVRYIYSQGNSVLISENITDFQYSSTNNHGLQIEATYEYGTCTGDCDPANGADVTAGSEQYLESNVFDASSYAFNFTFDWNMNVGDNADASLHLDAWNGTSWDLDVTGAAINTGNNNDVWVTEGPIDLSTYANADFKLRIRYMVGNGTIYLNDVAIDNLIVTGTGTGGGSDLKVMTHGDTLNPPRPYTYSNACVDCHNPMYVQPNLAFIRPTVTKSVLGGTIDFTEYTGAGSFADGSPYTDNICDTCHSLTQHHQADGSAPGGQSHNDATDCALCHPHLEGFQPQGGCTVCHSQSPPIGSLDTDRRQIVEGTPGDGQGDFVKISHHVTDGTTTEIVTDDDCIVCHDQSSHQSFGDGQTVLLNDQDGGASSIYDGTGASIEGFCVSCHDADGSTVYGPQPFSAAGDTNSPPDIGWSAGVVSHSAFDVCFNCHEQGHGSDFEKILTEDNEPGLCFNCHDTDGPASTDISSNFAQPFGHPVTAANSSIHCLDCHNPHQAEPGTHTPDGQWYPSSPDANTNLVSGVLSGVMGVEPSPWAPAWTKTDSYTVLDSAVKEYQICFKCHARYSHQYSQDCFLCHPMTWDPDLGAIIAGFKFRSAQREFNINNKSAHSVVVTSNNQSGSYAPKALSTSQMEAPWTNTGNQTMYCSDCHGAENENAGDPRGPHGSGKPFMLKGPNTMWPAGSVRLFSLNDVSGDSSTESRNTNWRNELFCLNCHDSFPSSNRSTWQNEVHREHDDRDYEPAGGNKRNVYCIACHAIVPHGSHVSRLITYRSELPEYNTYNDVNYNVIEGFRKTSRFNYSEDDCRTASNFGCDKHDDKVNTWD